MILSLGLFSPEKPSYPAPNSMRRIQYAAASRMIMNGFDNCVTRTSLSSQCAVP